MATKKVTKLKSSKLTQQVKNKLKSSSSTTKKASHTAKNAAKKNTTTNQHLTNATSTFTRSNSIPTHTLLGPGATAATVFSTKTATGISRSACQKFLNDMENLSQSLSKEISNLAQEVANMQKNVWHGGAEADKWYQSIQETYAALVTYMNGLENLKTAMMGYLGEVNSIANF